MKKVLIVLLVAFSLSCTNEEGPNAIPVSINLYLEIVDQNGNDLLNPVNATINSEDIKVFYRIDNKLEEVFNPDMDEPRNFLIFYHEGKMKNLLVLGLGGEETILKLNDSDSVSFVPEWHILKNGGKVLSKIYFQDKLVYDNTTASDVPSLKIVLD